MGWYHSMVVDDDVPSIVFHICPKSHFNERCAIYYPKTYDEDKFTRASHMPDRLIETANCFYKDDKEMEWVCLQINVSGLTFHSIEIKMVPSDIDKTLKCPHIYGGLPRECINKVYPVERTEDGTFVFVKGLTDMCCAKK
jgi:uncharacterized protein (DUF952 family)